MTKHIDFSLRIEADTGVDTLPPIAVVRDKIAGVLEDLAVRYRAGNFAGTAPGSTAIKGRFFKSGAVANVSVKWGLMAKDDGSMP